MLVAENYKKETTIVNDISLVIITYKIGESYHCHIENADPGAVIARAYAKNLQTAKEVALSKAKKRLGL